jgi:hypothetical protein
MKHFIFLFCFLIETSTYSQDLTFRCTTDSNQLSLIQADPLYKMQCVEAQNQVQNIIKNYQDELKKSTGVIYTIPVVVHVLHYGEPLGTGFNMSDLQVQTAIGGLNDRFANILGSGLDIEIRFCLALRDPNNCLTNGIDRIDASGMSSYVANGLTGSNRDSLQDLGNWPKDAYMNIWVVNNNGNGGTTTYQFSPYGGIIIDRSSMIYTGTTLVHEMGHLLGLAHTFAGGESGVCPVDTNCSINGDGVCDTPPHRQTDCGDSLPCSATGDWYNSRNNYMSYCAHDRFTQGQKDKMRAFVLSPAFNELFNSISCDTTLHATFTKSDVTSCHGACEGSITAIPLTCSSNNFHYNWSTGQTSQTISGLCAGTYHVTITDATNSNSTTSLSATINEPSDITIAISTDTNTCNYGTATANVSGGIPITCGPQHLLNVGALLVYNSNTGHPAPYANSHKSAFHTLRYTPSELQALGFSGGTMYSVALNVFANSGTSTYDNWEIQIGPSTSLLQTVYGPQTITITTGWNSYTFSSPYSWDGASDIYIKFCFLNSTVTVNARTYYDGAFVSASRYQFSDTLNLCNPPGVYFVTTTKPSTQFVVCNDSSYYHYLWSNGQTSQTATGLVAGNYSVIVTDGNGCTKTQSVIVPSSVTVTLIGGNLITSCPTSGCSYQWYNDGIPVGTNSPTVPYSGSGNYTVVITDDMGCIFSGSYLTTSIEDTFIQNNIHLYPNPTSENFTVEIDSKYLAFHPELTIYDMLGKCIFRKALISSETTINKETITQGVYCVKIKAVNYDFVSKLLIK